MSTLELQAINVIKTHFNCLFKNNSITSLLVITTVQQLEAKSTGGSTYANKFNVCTKMMMKVV